jgi:hypothetical protein
MNESHLKKAPRGGAGGMMAPPKNPELSKATQPKQGLCKYARLATIFTYTHTCLLKFKFEGAIGLTICQVNNFFNGVMKTICICVCKISKKETSEIIRSRYQFGGCCFVVRYVYACLRAHVFTYVPTYVHTYCDIRKYVPPAGLKNGVLANVAHGEGHAKFPQPLFKEGANFQNNFSKVGPWGQLSIFPAAPPFPPQENCF